uniref:Uncharacterized protein n=1 Tax=Oryza brachyantha TaxID=4533 RepID=J3LUZ6_ORYBR
MPRKSFSTRSSFLWRALQYLYLRYTIFVPKYLTSLIFLYIFTRLSYSKNLYNY